MSCEDIYVSRKFAKDAIKTKNVAASPGFAPQVHLSVAASGQRQTVSIEFQNEMTSPKAQTIVLMGTDLTVSHPIVWLEVLEAVKNGANLIVVSPTELASTRFATQWLRNRVGSEIHLLGIQVVIIQQKKRVCFS